MAEIDRVIQAAAQYIPDLDEKRVRSACFFAESLQPKVDMDRALEVAFIASSLRLNEDALLAAFFYAIVRRDPSHLFQISEHFGPSVSHLVESVQQLGVIHTQNLEQELESIRRMFLAMAKDLRVVLIKLASRLYTMRSLSQLTDENKDMVRETLDIYAPIAARLGVYAVKSELEDLSFRHLFPQEFFDIDKQLAQRGEQRDEWIEYAQHSLQSLLHSEGVEAKIEGRCKTHYSIYRKLLRKNKNSLDDMYDLFAIRIILPDRFQNGKESLGQLYEVLGMIHNHFVPLPKRFKDYVAMPKANGYRSLHTAILGLGGSLYQQPTEIQIRTESMHQDAEHGIAAHWLYENHHHFDAESLDSKHLALKRKIEWLSGLQNLQKEMQQSSDIIQDLQLDIFKDRIFVLTPQGEVKDLPKGATPIDFAYAVHTDIGHRTTMAKVNGSPVSLDYSLQNGDVVQILTRPHPKPNRYWLSFAKTIHARNKIKSWFRSQDCDNNFRAGKDMLNRELAKLGKAPLDPALSALRTYTDKKMTIRDRESILENIGMGLLSVSSVLKKMFSHDDLLASKKTASQPLPAISPESPAIKAHSESNILVAGEVPNFPLTLAACCNPHPEKQEPIIGYITRGRGVTVHKVRCGVIRNIEPQRLIDVSWAQHGVLYVRHYQVKLTMKVVERVGLIRDITTIIAGMGINIDDLSIQGRRGDRDYHYIETVVSVRDFDQLDQLLYRLTQNVAGVLQVKKQ